MTEVQTQEGQTVEGQEGQQEGQEGQQEGQEGTNAKARQKAPDTSQISLDAIDAAVLAPPDLVTAAQPSRERKPEQKRMDAKAVEAYAAWVEAGRPSQWEKMPVVTYFLDESEVKGYRYLIRRACDIVEPQGDATGVRVRFGTEFTLSERMAEKLGIPELAGKTVLAWAAIDKRNVDRPAATAAASDGQTETAKQKRERQKREREAASA